MLSRRKFILMSLIAPAFPTMECGAQSAQPNRIQAWNAVVQSLETALKALQMVHDALKEVLDKGSTVTSVELIGSVHRTDPAFKLVSKAWKQFKEMVL